MQNTFPNRQWFYVKRPEGRVGAEHYALREQALDGTLAANEVIVRASIISVTRISASSSTSAIPTTCRIRSASCSAPAWWGRWSRRRVRCFKEGDWVSTYSGWQLYARVPSERTDEARSVDGARLHRARRARHAGAHRVVRADGGGAAASGRHARRVGRSGRGRLARRAVRQARRAAAWSASPAAPDKCRFLTDTLKLDGARRLSRARHARIARARRSRRRPAASTSISTTSAAASPMR